MRLRSLSRLIAPAVVALTCLLGRAAHAVPPYQNLQPAANYGSVSATLVSSDAATCTYEFTVTNTTPAGSKGSFGIKGVLVYGPRPIAINSLDRASVTLYGAGRASWWDYNGGPDGNGNGLVDRYIEPGETDNSFRLTYAQPCPKPEDLRFGLHVVVPFTGQTFFSYANAPCAALTGKVLCAPTGAPIQGATVQLLRGGTVLQTATSGAGGQFGFNTANLADGAYTIQVLGSTDLLPAQVTFNYACAGPDIQANISVTPKALKPLCEEKLCGSVFFANDAIYRRLAVAGVTLSAADLTNPAYASGPLAGTPYRSYRYSGPVPKFPGLSGASQEIYVIIEDPLVADEGKWNSCSFTNQVGVAKNLLGTGPSTVFTYRTNFNFGFAPDSGTAYNFKLDGFEYVPAPTAVGPTTVLPLVKLDGTAPMAFAGTVPPGYLFRAQFQFDFGQGQVNTVWGVGSYEGICGAVFPYRCHPPMGGGPG